jgi:hypothetical protein
MTGTNDGEPERKREDEEEDGQGFQMATYFGLFSRN